MRFLTDERWGSWIGEAMGLTVFQVMIFSTHVFFPFVLLLQQCNTSFGQLVTTGKCQHFRSASNPEPVFVETPAAISEARIFHTVQHEPETLAEARDQIGLLVAAITQLEKQVHDVTNDFQTSTPKL